MSETDIAILEFLDKLGDVDGERVVAPPRFVHENLVEQMKVVQKSETTISRRMKKLADNDLLEKMEDSRGSYYRMTQLGEDYLAGNVDADELE